MKGGTVTVSQVVTVSSPLDTWTQRTSNTTEDLNDITVGNGRAVAVGWDSSAVYSDNGSSWTQVNPGSNAYLEGVTYDGVQFVACGADYNYDQSGWEMALFTSADGTSWSKVYGSGTLPRFFPRFLDVAFGGGVYVAVGHDGAIYRSVNGTTWGAVTSGTTFDLDGVTYGDGVFVAVGADTGGGPVVVLTSPDGVTWTDTSSGAGLPSSRGFYEVEFLNDRFLAGGWLAQVNFSVDQGQTFSSTMADDQLVFRGFAYGSGLYLATGYRYVSQLVSVEVDYASADGANWVELNSPLGSDRRNEAVFFNNTFITVGDGGSIWQSDSISTSAGGFGLWQLQNMGALGFSRDPDDDSDFDGATNLEEYARGTGAADENSFPPDAIVSAAGTYFQVSYDRDSEKSDVDYVVERATDLTAEDWSTVSTVVVSDTATTLTVRSAVAISSAINEFFRLTFQLK
jgi:hypothetical protein